MSRAARSPPHHTAAERVDGGDVRVHTLFVVEPEREGEVRQRIRAALFAGRLEGADGQTTRWRLRITEPVAVREDEEDHARRLAAS